MDQSKEFDKVLEELGPRGSYQKRVFLLLCVPCALSSIYLAFSQIFVSAVPSHWCDISEFVNGSNLSYDELKVKYIPLHHYPDGRIEPSRCFMYDFNSTESSSENITKECSSWTYDTSNYEETLATKFDLVCGNSWFPTMATTAFVLGSLFGTAFSGWACDRWGRKFMLMPVLVLNILLPFISAFSVNYTMYTIMRGLSGTLFPAIYQIPFILSMELLGAKDRTAGGIILGMIFALSQCVMSSIAYLTRHWFYFIMANVLPQFFLLSYFWLIPESPRWLLSKNRVDEAEEIIQQIAAVNKVKNRKLYLEKFKEIDNTNNSHEKVDFTPLDLFSHKNIRIKYLIILYNWGVNAIVYHGLSYYTTHLEVNTFLAFFIGGIMEFIGCALAWWGMEKFGRKSMLAWCMFLGGLACVSSVFFQGFKWVTMALAMFGKLGCSAAFTVFYLFVAELLPTVVRSQAMSLSSFSSNIVLLVFPRMISLADDYKVLPLIIMGSLSMLGGSSALILPETLGEPLPQTLEDAEKLPPELYCFKRKTNQDKEEMESLPK